VRDLGWDRANLWHELLRAYPYGLHYQAHPEQNLRKLDRDVAQASGSKLAHLRADWFIATATRPPLYHTLLELPHTDWQLENKLGVDVRRNFERDKLARAGFSKSGVSGQNRLLERHEALFGAYWKSYDFKEKSQRNDLKRFPLGPLNLFPDRQHPYPDQAFIHDGGEIIFNLPNGMQGYFLIKGTGERIDQGPEDVVSDSLKTSGTNAIVNGLSCMACHVNGSIPFKDQLRAGTAVFGQPLNKVQDLYPVATVMDKWVKEDEERFLTATDKIVRPFLPAGKAPLALKEALKKLGEPVGVAARSYRLQPLDLNTIACELGEKSADKMRLKIGDGTLRELGLGVVLQNGGVINRAEWEIVRARSLMQRVAVHLDAAPVKVD
jgi:hypothetical protein